MAGAILRTAARHGDNLREFTLVAAGGAGGLSAVALAQELGMPQVLVPLYPGLFSAAGLLAAELRHDLAVSLMMDPSDPDEEAIGKAQAQLVARVGNDLAVDGIPADRQTCEHALDLRYFGQEYAVTVPTFPGEALDAVVVRFHQLHERVYGHSSPGSRVEITATRVVGRGTSVFRDMPTVASEAIRPAASRAVWFAEADGHLDTAIIDRAALAPGARLDGPAIVEQIDTTTVIPPGWRALVDERRCLIIEEIRP